MLNKVTSIIVVLFLIGLNLSGCHVQNKTIHIYYISDNCATSQIIEQSWENQVSELLNRNIDIHYISTSNSNEEHDCDELGCAVSDSSVMFDYQEFVDVSKLNGLVYSDNPLIIKELILNEALLQIENNKEVIRIHEIAECNGKNSTINYTLPLSSSDSPVLRSYNADIMKNYGLNPPTNIEELNSLINDLIEKNKEGRNKIYFCESSPKNVSYDFADIFRAYGVFPNGLNPFTYNPISQQYEETIRNKNFYLAINQIKKFVDSGVVIMDSNEIQNNNQPILSDYYFAYGNNYNNKMYSWYIEGINSSYLIKENEAQYCIGILKNTNQTNSIISDIIGRINDTDELIMSFAFGVENINYVDKGNYYKLIESEGDFMYYPIISNYFSLEKPIGLELEEAEHWSKLIEDYYEYRTYFHKIFNKFESNLFYMSPNYIEYNCSNQDFAILSDAYENVFINIFDNEMNVEDAIYEYVNISNKIIRN